MSRETNNEIDLLLRRMGRREDGIARAAAAPGDDRHLDADELSSYAQNALPAAARARYTAHLTECATCRRLVTELSLSLGAATAPVAAAHEPSGWKSFLAGLFSPFVLRYAVPALGVIVVMVVGFVVLRQRGDREFVAQLQQTETATPAAGPSAPATVADGQIEQRKQAENKPETSNGKPSETRQKTEAEARNAISGASVDAPVTKDEQSVAELKPAATATPAPAAPAKAATADEPAKTDAVAKKQEEQPKQKAADEVAAAAPEPQSTRGFYSVEPVARPTQTAPKPGSATTSSVGGLARVRAGAAKTADEDKNANKRDEAGRADTQYVDNETKTIAGRRFRKQGGIWTDTAYDSSTATVNMARNSEQFRALVADEPAIGTIARQLEGEVIVVWKGRAYHIR